MMPNISSTYRLAAEAHRATTIDRWRARSEQSSTRKIAEIAIGKALHGLSFKAFINQFEGYRFLDSGWEAVVLEDETADHVMKVHLKNTSLKLEAAQQMAVEQQQASDLGARYLGDQWLPTAFYPHRMRLFPSMVPGYGVVALQERLKPDMVFNSAEHLAQYAKHPVIASELLRLYDSITTMADETGIYPDIRGSRNIALVGDDQAPKLKIMDTSLPTDREHFDRPVPEKSKTIGEDILDKLRVWEIGLAGEAVAEDHVPIEWTESQAVVLH